jgi:hypothetical protein
MATVYVRLLDEGVDTWRPVPATNMSNGLYRLLATENYDPEDENWEFLPGATVEAEVRQLSDGPTLVAVRLASLPFSPRRVPRDESSRRA